MAKRPYRKNRKDLCHYGSDFNKFAHEHCTKEMDIMNIDTWTYRACKGMLRVFESKHSKEKLTQAERKHLRAFAFYHKDDKRLPTEVFTIYGEAPYRGIVIIENMLTGKKYKFDFKRMIDRDKLVKWVQFDLTTEEFLGEKYNG